MVQKLRSVALSWALFKQVRSEHHDIHVFSGGVQAYTDYVDGDCKSKRPLCLRRHFPVAGLFLVLCDLNCAQYTSSTFAMPIHIHL